MKLGWIEEGEEERRRPSPSSSSLMSSSSSSSSSWLSGIVRGRSFNSKTNSGADQIVANKPRSGSLKNQLHGSLFKYGPNPAQVYIYVYISSSFYIFLSFSSWTWEWECLRCVWFMARLGWGRRSSVVWPNSLEVPLVCSIWGWDGSICNPNSVGTVFCGLVPKSPTSWF